MNNLIISLTVIITTTNEKKRDTIVIATSIAIQSPKYDKYGCTWEKGTPKMLLKSGKTLKTESKKEVNQSTKAEEIESQSRVIPPQNQLKKSDRKEKNQVQIETKKSTIDLIKSIKL